jgi:translocation and assembly module TamB
MEIKESQYEDVAHAYLKEIPENLLIFVNGRASLKGTINTFNGSIFLNSLKLMMYGHTFTNTEVILLSLDGPDVDIESFRMKTGPATITVDGSLGLRSGYNLTLYGNSYLSPLKGFFTGVDQIKGYLDFVFGITGKWREPTFNGGLSIQDMSIAFKGIPYRVRSINGYAYLDENTLILEQIKGEFASGEITLQGIGQLEGWKIPSYLFDGFVKDVNLRIQEGVSFKLSGDFSFSKRKESVNLIGDLRILSGRYARDMKLKSWIISSKKIPIEKLQGGFLDDIELNINIYGDEDIYIENNIARAPARVDLVVLGTLNDPSLLGRVELDRGKIFFRNNDFTILHASADFTDPDSIYPFLDLGAQTRVRNYDIDLSLEGYIEEFNLSLSSDPVLDEADIFSLLTVGTISSDMTGLESGIGASEAASFLTGELQDTLEERLRNITGFDRIQLETHVAKKSGTVGPKITVSRRLLSDKLYVTYTTSLVDITEQFLRLEFLVNDNVSLIGESDEFGTVGADIKFRVEFR